MNLHETNQVNSKLSQAWRNARQPPQQIRNRDHMPLLQSLTVRVWGVDSGESILTLPASGDVYGISFSPDGSLIACANDDGALNIWDARPLNR